LLFNFPTSIIYHGDDKKQKPKASKIKTEATKRRKFQRRGRKGKGKRSAGAFLRKKDQQKILIGIFFGQSA
jgi:hypothetical protein